MTTVTVVTMVVATMSVTTVAMAALTMTDIVALLIAVMCRLSKPAVFR